MTVYVHVCMYIPRICPIDAYCVKQTTIPHPQSRLLVKHFIL